MQHEAGANTGAAYLASIIEFSSDAITSMDLDGNITSWNRTAEKLFGYERAEILHRPQDILIPQDRKPEKVRLLERLARGEIIAQFETQRRAKDGSLVDVSMTASAIRDGQGALIGFSAILHDIRKAKAAERELQRLQVEMVHLSRRNMMGLMSSSLAHELNQPLTAAMSFVRAARHTLPPGEGQPQCIEYLDLAVEEIKLAGDIIRSLRQFIEKDEITLVPCDINRAVTESLRLSMTAKAHTAHRIECRLAANLPLVPMDKVQVQQVILNLLRNAIEATIGQPDPHIILLTEAEPDHVLVTVRDNGPGLGAALEKIFQPFNTTKTDGMGVGLSICRGIVEAHGGRIWAENGQGAVFRFTLPLEPRR